MMDAPSSRRGRYLEHAADLRAMAEAARDPDVKAELLVLAQQYDKLADDVGRGPRAL